MSLFDFRCKIHRYELDCRSREILRLSSKFGTEFYKLIWESPIRQVWFSEWVFNLMEAEIIQLRYNCYNTHTETSQFYFESFTVMGGRGGYFNNDFVFHLFIVQPASRVQECRVHCIRCHVCAPGHLGPNLPRTPWRCGWPVSDEARPSASRPHDSIGNSNAYNDGTFKWFITFRLKMRRCLWMSKNWLVNIPLFHHVPIK